MKTKKIIIRLLGMFICILMLASCNFKNDTSEKTGQSSHNHITYGFITREYGYSKVDSMITYRGIALDANWKEIKGKFVDTTFTLACTSTYILFKLPRKKTDKVIPIDTIRNIYPKECLPDRTSKLGRFKAYIGFKKSTEPYTKVLGHYICYRPGFSTTHFILAGQSKVYKTITAQGGHIQDPGHYYPYYFYGGDDSLYVLDRTTLTSLHVIPHASVNTVCHNSPRYIIMNCDNYLVFYDSKLLKIVVDHRSNKLSNVLLGNEYVSRYTSLNNGDELDGTNLMKVAFMIGKKEVVSLLDQTTMTHCSDILYEDIQGFDKEYLIGIVQPNNIHNVTFTDAKGNIFGSIGHAEGQNGGFSPGYFYYDGDVDLDTKTSQTSRARDNFNLGLLISKKTGKETGAIYQIFDSGQKVKIR